jgi:ABC-type branched-subunit amino acid transport system substrate-binding protein/DNA-binding beta-propeller fold protein YncE
VSLAVGPGSTFAGYRVESLLGRGGMGVVYRATDLSLDRPVALKLIAPELAEDKRFRERFLREPRLAAALDHPHVVPIHEAGEHDGQLYLAMRFVEGSDLKSIVEREGKLAPERALALLAQIADALDAAHRRGLVHRDVKPANVLVDADGHAYLTDFGISKQLGGASTDTGQMVGTLDYLAPEQIRGERVDGRADCYALACVLYECLAGEPPFRRETEAETLWAHMHDPSPRLSAEPWLDPVLAQALAKDPAERYSTCGDLLAAASSALGFEPPARRRARRLRVSRALVLAGGALILAAAVAAAVVELTGGEGSAGAIAPVAPDSVAVFDPSADRIIGEVRIPGQPSLVAARGRSVWVASDTSRTISRIDGRRLAITKVVPTNAIPHDLDATSDSVWLLAHGPRGLIKVSAAYGSVDRLPLHPTRRSAGPWGAGVDIGQGSVWVADGSTRLLKIDQGDGRIVKEFELPQRADGVAAGARTIWTINAASASVYEIDPASGSVRPPIRVTSRPGSTRPVPIAIAVGAGAVWVLNGNTPSVTRIDPELATVTDTITFGVGSNPTAIATGAGAVWVALSGEGSVARIDQQTGDVRSIPVGGAPTGVAVSLGKVWISVQPGFRSELASRGRTILAPGRVEGSFCSGVEFARQGRPDFLIASDLPLQHGAGPFPTLQLSDAVRFVLARRDFRAGAYSIGYQSCDHSSVGRGAPYSWTPATCRRNARAVADAPMVLGVIGPFDSSCAAFQIPILNRAPDGPLALISGSTTSTGLTHEAPGSGAGEPEMYYPRDMRNFARVVAADDVQGAAVSVMAERLGVTRLFVLEDGETYGSGIAAQVRKSARRLGIGIAGTARWDYRNRSFARLARRVGRSGADGVFLGGFVPGGPLRTPVRDLREVLGPDVQLLAPDGFSDFEALVEGEGAAAEGMVVSFPIVPASHLPSSGREFAEAFEKAISGPAEPYSPAVAQATAVLLDAIAASDGTRASVTRNLFGTRVENGILGTFEFDENGDTTAAGVTMYRIQNGRPRVVEVITPPTELVR